MEPDLSRELGRLEGDAHVRAQTLAFLGHTTQEVTEALGGRIEAAIGRVVADARVSYAIRTFEPDAIPFLYQGDDIRRHLAEASHVTLFAVTLGLGVDRTLRLLATTDATGQVIYDAAASAVVERLADVVETRIRARIRERGLFASWRFSPGYGDLPLAVQAPLLASIDAGRLCGITLTDSHLMVPTKSVSAIVGAHATAQTGLPDSCAVCSLREVCQMRVRGVTCLRGHTS